MALSFGGSLFGQSFDQERVSGIFTDARDIINVVGEARGTSTDPGGTLSTITIEKIREKTEYFIYNYYTSSISL